MLELLSPAGSPEAVVAAVQSGADAIYLGLGSFNARRSAKNFTEQEFLDSVKYCHERGCKVYVTLNTLASDREMEDVAALGRFVSEAGADAVLVQDLGVARVLRSVCPDLPLHASTQMSVHNLGGVHAAAQMGITRVVLARELTLDQIAVIASRSPIEVEVFVHGALCFCHSGQCYMSSLIGRRSGNRGMCAQPCRMQYSFQGSAPGYPLSLKDSSMAQHLKELERAGVHTLKIEGRMKRPEYTALVTNIYKRALVEQREPTKEELEQLQTVFSRDGFTDGYLMGKRGNHMFGTRKEEAGREARAVYKQAQALYETQPEPPSVPVELHFSARAGQEMTLAVTDRDGNRYETTGLPAEAALNRATTEEEVAASLSKTGGTVFKAEKVHVELEPGLRASAAALNAMRRQCLEGLALVRRRAPERRTGDWQPGLRRLPYEGKPGLIYSFRSVEQLSSPILRSGPAMIWLPLSEIVRHLPMVQALMEKGLRFAAVLDRVIFDSQWPPVLEELRKIKEAGITDLVLTNIGQIHLMQTLGFTLHGDFGLNVMNSQSVKELRQMGLQSCTLSFEMNLAQIRDMSLGLDSQIIAYGRLPLMITENCITKRHGDGCARDGRACSGNNNAIVDKTGRSFPILRENHCRSTLYNAEKLWLADKMNDLNGLGLRWLRLNFTTENTKEIEAVITAYQTGTGTMPERATRGLYYRGVQ